MTNALDNMDNMARQSNNMARQSKIQCKEESLSRGVDATFRKLLWHIEGFQKGVSQ